MAEARGKIDWRFAKFFSWWRSPVEDETNLTRLSTELQKLYPENAPQIMEFLANILRRRQPIVERLRKHPELNDHGFFMVICKLYMDTYHGVGYTNSAITRLIETFATADISHGTAARKLQKAYEVGVFEKDSDKDDSRKQRYYLHPDMIRMCTEAFGGMIDDVLASSAASQKDGQPEGNVAVEQRKAS
jgi:hypothetical protein